EWRRGSRGWRRNGSPIYTAALCLDLLHGFQQRAVSLFWRIVPIYPKKVANVGNQIGVGQKLCPVCPFFRSRFGLSHFEVFKRITAVGFILKHAACPGKMTVVTDVSNHRLVTAVIAAPGGAG